jgi:transposase
VREYLYAFAAISPHDGHMSTLIADHVNAHTMSVHLQHVANEYPDEEILMILDGASWHRAKDLRIPLNMTLKLLPPYSPELNPVEHLWDDIREKYFANKFFNSLDAVAEQLTDALREMHSDKQRVKSMSSFPWIIEEQESGNWH